MKNKILLTTLALLVAVPSFAYISRNDTYSSNFLKLNGYSDSTIKMVNHERNKAAGIPNEPNKKIIKNKVVRTLYNAYEYIDPAVEGSSFLFHNIDIEPNVNDL